MAVGVLGLLLTLLGTNTRVLEEKELKDYRH
jgi:hypothetical protein